MAYTREIPINEDEGNIIFKLLRPENAVPYYESTLVRVQSFDEATGVFSCVPSSYDEWLETRGNAEKVLALPHGQPIIGKRETEYKNIAATSAILTSDGYYMFVERADGEREFKKAWELGPSIAPTPTQFFGDDDNATLQNVHPALMEAVTEKIGIPTNKIENVELLKFYEAAECYESTSLIKVGLKHKEVSKHFKAANCPEYSGRVKFVRPNGLKAFEEPQPTDKWVSTTKAILPFLQKYNF